MNPFAFRSPRRRRRRRRAPPAPLPRPRPYRSPASPAPRWPASSRCQPAGGSVSARSACAAYGPSWSALLALAALLNLWALARNGWANDYYSAAVRSMSSSWHNFLFASFDPSGVMTVDKPPLALWVQALSVRVFGFHPLSILVPQALMGVASVALVYDLVRRRFGRLGGFVAGPRARTHADHRRDLAPQQPRRAARAVLRRGAVVRGARARGRPHPLARAGRRLRSASASRRRWASRCWSCPAIALAWLWVAPRGRLHALRQLLAGGAAMVRRRRRVAAARRADAGGRPPVDLRHERQQHLVADLRLQRPRPRRRPDRRARRRGGGGGGGSLFGGATGPLRLLNAALGGQAGWLLGFALVGGVAHPASPAGCAARDPRTGWLIAVGGAFLTTAVAVQLRPRASSIPTTSRCSRRSPPRWSAPAPPSWSAAVCSARIARRRSRRRRRRLPSWSCCTTVPGPARRGCAPLLIVVRRARRARAGARSPRKRARARSALAVVLARAADRAGALGGRHARPRHQRHVPRRRPRVGLRRSAAASAARAAPAAASAARRSGGPAGAAGAARARRGLAAPASGAARQASGGSGRRRRRRRSSRGRRRAAPLARGRGGAGGGGGRRRLRRRRSSLTAGRSATCAARRRHDRRLQPVHARRRRSSPATPRSPASAASPAARARSALAGWPAK